jgi:hypothetical protein
MKNTQLLILAVTLLFAPSCSKKKCWICTQTTTTTGNAGYNGSATDEATICDKTESEIRNIEKQGSSSSSGTAGGMYFSTTTTVKCQ